MLQIQVLIKRQQITSVVMVSSFCLMKITVRNPVQIQQTGQRTKMLSIIVLQDLMPSQRQRQVLLEKQLLSRAEEQTEKLRPVLRLNMLLQITDIQ